MLYSNGAPHVWCAISGHSIYSPFPSSVRHRRGQSVGAVPEWLGHGLALPRLSLCPVAAPPRLPLRATLTAPAPPLASTHRGPWPRRRAPPSVPWRPRPALRASARSGAPAPAGPNPLWPLWATDMWGPAPERIKKYINKTNNKNKFN